MKPLYPSSPRGTASLSADVENDVWDADYEAASFVYTKRVRSVEGVDLFINSKDKRLPLGLTEEHPQFWEYLGTFVDGAKAFAEDMDDFVVT